MYMWNICLFTHVVSQNYAYFRIQCFFHEQLIQNSMIFAWFFHFYKFQELFIKFTDFSMILKQIWISKIFQELWEPCICVTQPGGLLSDASCFKFPENSFKMIQNSFNSFKMIQNSFKSETETQGVGINLQEDTWFHQNWN